MLKGLQFALLLWLAAGAATAEGDLTRRATRLEPLLIEAASGFSVKSYKTETGVYYRWRIESDGLDEYRLVAPGLFRESWIEQVAIEDIEVHPAGLLALEFDDVGSADIWFVTIRPGRYPFYVEGLETQGFSGEFVVE
jgi:hypothetical protein